MLSKLRYLTQHSTVRGSQTFLNKATTDFSILSKVCFHCDSIHSSRNTANITEYEVESKPENDDFTSHVVSCGDETAESTFKSVLDEAKSLGDISRKQYGTAWSRNYSGPKVEQNPINYSNILENYPASNVIQKRDLSTSGWLPNQQRDLSISRRSPNLQRDLSTSRWLPNQKTPTRRTHTDTSMGWIAGLKHLMYGDQEPKAAFAELGSPPDEASLSYLLWGCDTIQDVLNLVEPRIERKELDINQYVEVMQKLQMIIYKDLGQKYAWLAEDIIPGIFVYLLLNDVKVSEFKYLEGAPAFQRLQDNLVELLDHMTVPQFAACMSGFVWLGVEATSPTLVKFVSKLPEFRDEDFTVLSLHILSVCLLSFERPDILVTTYIYPRLKALMKNTSEIPNDKKTLFSLMFLGHCRMPDIDVCVWLTEQVLKIVEETDHLKDPFLAAMAIKFCRDIRRTNEDDFSPNSLYRNMALDIESEAMSEGVDELWKLDQKLLDIVIIHLLENYNILSCSDVARVAHSANRLGISRMPWAEFIQKRSLDLILSENLSVGQLSQAITGLKDCMSMDKSTVDQIERILLNTIDVADVTSTTFILDYLSSRGTENHELLRACQRKVIEHIDGMRGYRMLSKRMYQFLGRFPMENEEDHMVLQTKLMDSDNISFHDDMILRYLISQHNWLPTSPILLNFLTKELGYCSFKDYFRLVCNAGNWISFKKDLAANRKLNRDTFAAITNFEVNIGKRYFRTIEAMDRLSDILYLTYKVGAFNPKILCMKTLMRIVEKCTDSEPLEDTNFRILTKILEVREGYISPKMFDRLLDAFLLMKEERPVIGNNMLEIICKWFCCESEQITAPFKAKVNDILQSNIELFTNFESLPVRVRNMEYLCMLGVFPKDALIDLLNVDTLSRLDNFIDEKGDKNFKRRAYQRILNINRCIVIDMPEIQIPWFMGQYVEEWRHANSDSNPVRSRQLMKIMGEVVGAGTFGYQKPLEYGYTASFVCLMNKDNQLMPYSENNFRFAQELGIQRLVIEFVFSDQQNPSSLITQKLRQNHLKKLGYKLIEIHDWELQSIALSKRHDRINYIRNKILGQPHLPAGPPTYKVLDEDEEVSKRDVGMEELETLLNHPVKMAAMAM